METSNLLGAEFTTQAIRMLKELRGRVDGLSENLNKAIGNTKLERKNIKKNKSEMKNTLTEMKNTLLGINIAIDEADEQIRDLEDK